MPEAGIIESFFYIFAGAALLATVALYTRQPLLVAYIGLGALLGPFGLSWVNDAALIAEIAEFGIIFLLFLVGLDLQPGKLRNMVGASLLSAVCTTVVFFALGFGIMSAYGFTTTEAIVTGIAACFSSTILGIKLLPTTVLHHRHVGELVISLLLIQDMLAILAILLLTSMDNGLGSLMTQLTSTFLVSLPILLLVALAGVRFVMLRIISAYDAFHEFIFLIAIGWCLGLAFFAHQLGLSFEIGAFIGGVSLATSPIAQYIAEALRPLRDFFLVLFFFGVGAGLNLQVLPEVWQPAILLGGLLIVAKPMVFRVTLKQQGESHETATEVGYRLGQASEFSLLLSYIALANALIGTGAGLVIQFATVLTLIVSSYFVIFRFPSPIAPNPALRRD